ncbi:MAG: thermonuclease family protein [Ignavibacteriota bacterium]|nr:thermonuclease family protein [Ignavibacteriota bacterium]
MFKLTGKIISSIFTLGLIILLVGFFIVKKFTDSDKVFDKNEKSGNYITVIRVVDGDTFELENKERVRLLGIDTPEKYESKKLDKDAESSGMDKKTIKKLGQLASDYVKGFVEGNKVRLERDPTNEDKDRYGRLLRYVYLEDGTCVNAKIVQDGYAQVYESFPITKMDEFRKLQREARENNRGLWGPVEGLKQFK